MIKLSQIQKITFSAVMIVMVIVCTRLLSFQNVIPFIRISLGPAIIVLASITLGPIYGGIVGGASDILGIVLFPNALGISINPLLTVVYTLFGIVPFFIYKLINLIKEDKYKFIAMLSFYGVAFIGTSLFLFLRNDVTILDYSLDVNAKIIASAILLVLISGLVVGLFFINRSFKKKDNLIDVYSVALSVSISEFFVMSLLNSWVKSFMFEIAFSFVFLMQLIVFFINIPLYSLFITYMLNLFKKVIVKRGQ